MLQDTSPETEHLRSLVIEWGRKIRTWNLPWKTGIYPLEMAAFLGMCTHRGVRGIVESGRGPDAYSTHVFGKFGEETGINTVSIDKTPVDDFHYGPTLRAFRHLACLSGNSFALLPEAFAVVEAPVALLVDGPKTFLANRLSLAACLSFPVDFVAHHNCDIRTDPWGREFKASFPDAFMYEDLRLESSPEWKELREWERACVGEHPEDDDGGPAGAYRVASCLAIAPVPSLPRLLWASLKAHRRHLRMSPFLYTLKWARKKRAIASR
jgi:hypothetical protein